MEEVGGREGCWMVVRGAKPPWKELAWRPPGPRGVLAGRPAMGTLSDICLLTAAGAAGWVDGWGGAGEREGGCCMGGGSWSIQPQPAPASYQEKQQQDGAPSERWLSLAAPPDIQKPKTGCLDEPEPIDLSVLHLDSLTSRKQACPEGSRATPGRSDRLKDVMKLPNISQCVCVCICVCVPSGPLEDGLEEEEEECVSEENELLAKDEFSAEENFSAEFETENMSCEDMEYFCNKGEDDGNREAGESEMDVQGEKTRHGGPEEWDGPSKKNEYHFTT
ncbi:Zinc finger protein ZFPM2 [Dissostichus eleginoides]|uniref:Zinc finger protein ZFPM2 n=1 Tax=Dissostichus eleginoides TaxID=100907 RepID=A0AAD9F7L5_DISEL|nr:Zinc finger protein ZFPM2 [Dissostichus eleginoides]